MKGSQLLKEMQTVKKYFLLLLVLQIFVLGQWVHASNFTGELTLRTDFLNADPKIHSRTLIKNTHYFSESEHTFDWALKMNINDASIDSSVEMRTAQLNFSLSDNISLTFGVDQQTWGRADQLNPIDFAYAEDRQRFYLEEKKYRKMGRLQTTWRYESLDTKLLIAYFPNSQANELAELNSIWCNDYCQLSQIKGQKIAYSTAGYTITVKQKKKSDHELAIRYTDRMNSIDFGLSYFYGSDHLTRVERLLLSENEVSLREIAPQSSMFGIDFAFSIGHIAARAEIAYYDNIAFYFSPTSLQSANDQDGLDYNSVLSSILSIDFHAFNSIYFNIQYLSTHIQKSTKLILPDEINLTTLLISKEWFNPELKFETAFSYDRDSSSRLTRLGMTWQFNYKQNISFGYLHFGGENNNGYASFKNNNSIYLTTQYLF